ncbi:hypothetical protein [Streptomyces sp. SM11]|nr:hypothetical protein [Streptomyces sp. SM11]
MYGIDDDSRVLVAGTERSGAALATYGPPAAVPPGAYASRMLTLHRVK